ncbi:hypothetical protein [Halobacteriovorax sp. ZH2_bin.1]|uniref:hypothetical protein n=1 Tax=unclassified Halobacteriovorax TaxID=2639665 RepID=UPI00372199B9
MISFDVFNKTPLNKKIALSYGARAFDYVETEDEFIRMIDGGLMTTFELRGLYDEPLTNEELVASLSRYNNLIVSVMKAAKTRGLDCVIQMTNSVRSEDHEPLKGEGLTEAIIADELNYIYNKFQKTSRSYYLTIRLTAGSGFKEKKDNSLFGLLLPSQSSLIISTDLARSIIYPFTNSSDLILKQSQPKEILDRVQFRISPLESLGYVESDENGKLGFHGNVEEKDNGELGLDDCKASVFYLNPRHDSIKIGGLREFLGTLPHTDYDVIYTVSGCDVKAPFDFTFLKLWYGNRPTEEIKNVNMAEDMVSPDVPMLKTSLKLVLYNHESDTDQKLMEESGMYLRAKFLKEKYISRFMFTTALEGNSSNADNDKIERSRRYLANQTLALLPIYSGPAKINYQDGVEKLSRYGYPVTVDTTKGSGNKMTAILGNSGGGKSVKLNDFVVEFLNTNPDSPVRIIDRTTSFEKIAAIYGGKTLKVAELSKAEGFSVFDIGAKVDEEDVTGLSSLINNVLELENSDFNPSSNHTEILKDAIGRVFLSKQEELKLTGKAYIVTWNDVLEEFPLSKNYFLSVGLSESIIDKCISDYTNYSMALKEGSYKPFFNIIKEIKDEPMAPIEIYDLEDMGNPKIQQVAYMACFLRVLRDLKKIGKGKPKAIVLDEFQMLINTKNKSTESIIEFVSTIVTTGRKSGYQVVTAANDVSCYTRKAGQTVWDISTIKIFLPLDNGFNSFKSSLGKDYSEADLSIIESLVLEKQLYRSSMYHIDARDASEIKKTSYYLYLSPMREAISTTTPKHLELYERLKSEEGSVEAVYRLAEILEKERM